MDNNYNNGQNWMGQNGMYQQQENRIPGQGEYTQQNFYQNQAQTTQAQGYGTAGYGSTPQPEMAEPKQKEKKRREKKEGGFGIKLAKCAALALVFGLVSGVVFEGVHFASRGIFDEDEQVGSVTGSVLMQADSDDRLEATAISSTYVASGVSDIVDAVMPSIVAITNVSVREYSTFWGRERYEVPSCGSGIIVSQDEKYLYIMTNNHVVSGANSLTVSFADDSTVSAEIRGMDPNTDLAVVMVELDSISDDTMENIRIATLGDSDSLRVGEMSIAIGNALGYGQSVTVGYISALEREVSVSDSDSGTSYTAELVQTDAAINPGNSGGALLNAAGEVIGINSVKYSDTDVEGIGYAIPVNTAMPIIEDLITKGEVDRSNSAYLGIAGVDVTSDVAETYGMPTGVFIAQVTEGSAAELAGIRRGDIITMFDGKKVTSMEELSMRLQNYKAGETVEIGIQRASEGTYFEQTLTVTLGSKN